ncbi:MAG: hypothetical protein M3033_04000 [Acidobacteriota bacterium]|nr:hypothetical protein [Acidobacteriota bacterium]
MRQKKLKIIVLVGFAALSVFGLISSSRTQVVWAKPAFMDRYKRDPFAKEELKSKCTICHIGRGGGERNNFGESFEDAGYRFTPKLRAKFPEMFNLPRDESPKNEKKDKSKDKPR